MNDAVSTIEEALEARSQTSVLLCGGDHVELTTAAVLGWIERLRLTFRSAGLDAGSRIAVALPNGPGLALCALGIMATSTYAPLNTRLRNDEMAFALRDLRADALVTARGASPVAERLAAEAGLPIFHVQADRDSISVLVAERGRRAGASSEGRHALLLHTSGTTAQPKMVGLTEAQLIGSARSVAATLQLSSGDRCLNVMPLFHIHGLVGALLATVVGGASIVCTDGYDAFAFRRQLALPDVTWTTAVPSMYQAMMLRAGGTSDRPNLRFVRSSSAAMPVSTWHGVEDRLECPLINAYGMTEASHQMTSNPLPPRDRRVGTVGVSAGSEVAIAVADSVTQAPDVAGEVVVRGPSVMAEYLSPPEANEHAWVDGWFRTGDLGQIDDGGYLRLIGRIKEIINVGGEKVSPLEVEAVLLEHPDVADAAAFGVGSALRGEVVYAAVTVRPGATTTPSTRELKQFAALRLAHFKTPDRIVLVDQIPLGPTGKVQRTRLAGQLGIPTRP